MPGRGPWSRGRLALEIGLFVGFLGIPDGALGVLWPSIRGRFDRPLGDLGVLLLAGTLPYLATSALTGRVLRRASVGIYLASAAAVGVVAVAMWLTAPVWAVVLGAFGLFGVARGAIDAALNAQVAAEHGIGRLGILHASYGVGATAGPVLATVLLVAGSGWRTFVAALLAITLADLAGAVHLRGAWVAPAPERELARSGRRWHGMRLLVLVTLATFFIYTGLEAAGGTWAYTFLTRSRHFSTGAAGAATAAYWAALTAGRFLLGFGGATRSRAGILLASGVATVAGAAVLWADPLGLGVAGLVLMGLGLAAVFPVLIALAPDRVGVARSPSLIGWSVASAALGAPVVAGLLGRVAQDRGAGALAPSLFALAVVLGGLMLLATAAFDRKPAGAA